MSHEQQLLHTTDSWLSTIPTLLIAAVRFAEIMIGHTTVEAATLVIIAILLVLLLSQLEDQIHWAHRFIAQSAAPTTAKQMVPFISTDVH